MQMRIKFFLNLLAAAFGGFALYLASPATSIWPLGFVGVALIIASLWRTSGRVAALFGTVSGAVFWLPHIDWLTSYLGPVPWLALSAVMVFWFALQSVVIAFLTRLEFRRIKQNLRFPLLIVAIAGVWVLREQLQTTWPFGGFSWGKIAHTQWNSPFAHLASWVGVTGLSAVMVIICAAVVVILKEKEHRFSLSCAALILVGVSFAIPVFPMQQTGSLRVAAVQGNAKAGIFDNREGGQVFRDHQNATQNFLNSYPDPKSIDALVWPENGAEFNLPNNLFRKSIVQNFAQQIDGQIVVGSILRDAGGKITNSAVAVDKDGKINARYDKQNPVPFGEYMPMRDFFHVFAPDLVDLVQLDYTPGTTSTVTDIKGVKTGLAICFDITFDRFTDNLAKDNAEAVFALTNNADFGVSAQSVQQLAITKLEAVAMGRSIVSVSTVGESEIIGADGMTIAHLDAQKQGTIASDVPAYQHRTPAMVAGGFIAGFWTLIGCVSVIFLLINALFHRWKR